MGRGPGQIVFGAGTGRCGTITLANLFGLSPRCLSMHEGQVRKGVEPVERGLPYLIIQNLAAYLKPESARGILEEFRVRQIAEAFDKRPGITHLVDVAYYYAPFLADLAALFPGARLFVLVRDGRSFVRSAYSAEVPDPMPAGYVDPRPLSPLERFAAAGRLRPRPESEHAPKWDSYSPFEKNCWLWAETNRIIQDSLDKWPKDQVRLYRFEELFDGFQGVSDLLGFAGLKEHLGREKVESLLERKLNARKKTVLPPVDQWDAGRRKRFWEICGPMMQRLGYPAGPDYC